MDFRTEIKLSPSPIRINHQSPVLTLGSCFAGVIGNKLSESKIPTLVNPFGVIFNPVSLLRLLNVSLRKKDLNHDSYVFNNGIWYHYDLHSELSHPEKDHLELLINEKISSTHDYLRNTKILTITFGTAFVYELKSNQAIVANCHKIPSTHFNKRLLRPEEILGVFKDTFTQLKKQYPEIQVILTLSPVRHIKDGIEQNAISKSILRYACHLITEQFPEISYFPSYEMIMDDLRDYRFYGKDMIHPSEVAEDYIWNKFLERYTDKRTQDLIQEWYTVKKALSHRAFHPDSEAHQKFLMETCRRLESLSSVIEVNEELKIINKLIADS